MTLYTVEFTFENDPSTYTFDAPGYINVVLGLFHYVTVVGGPGAILDTVTLFGINE